MVVPPLPAHGVGGGVACQRAERGRCLAFCGAVTRGNVDAGGAALRILVGPLRV